MKIIVSGDYCPWERVAKDFAKGDYRAIDALTPIFAEADYSIVNLECPILHGDEKPIVKSGPHMHADTRALEAIKGIGTKCVTLANNHFRDFGDNGVLNTLSELSAYGIDYVGGGTNLSDAAAVLYKKIGKETLAIVNCCEHESSIATAEHCGSNPLNPIQQYYAIHEAKKKADYMLVIVHGGVEHYELPTPRMQETYRFFIEAGADAVINHHQHCYSGYEIYLGKPIFYGLGNLCFDRSDKRNSIWNEGFLLELDLRGTKTEINTADAAINIDKQKKYNENTESLDTCSIPNSIDHQSANEQDSLQPNAQSCLIDSVAQTLSDDSEKNTKNISSAISFRLIPYHQCDAEAKVVMCNEDEKKEFTKRIEELNAIIANPEELQEQYEILLADTRQRYRFFVESYRSRIAKYLYRKHLLPSLMKKKYITLANVIQCESHRERLLDALKEK